MPYDMTREQINLSDAYFTAERVHLKQLDLRKRPYLFHVLEVAAACTQHGIKTVTVALLHDVLEQEPGFDLEDFEPDIRNAVDAITRNEGESYSDYINRCAENELARLVKIEDLKLNLATCPRESLKERYQRALYLLETRP
jgi:(p)ppGpp synthase/HD superfamily hydrolase